MMTGESCGEAKQDMDDVMKITKHPAEDIQAM